MMKLAFAVAAALALASALTAGSAHAYSKNGGACTIWTCR
jgi:hypothetical protein